MSEHPITHRYLRIGFAFAAATALNLFPERATGAIVQFQTYMDSLQTVPLTVMQASGTATFEFDTDTSTLTLVASDYAFLGGFFPSSAHIHGPAPVGVNGPPIITLGLTGFSFGSLTMTPTVLTATQIGWLTGGLMYVDLHTISPPGGGIRGQIFPTPTAVVDCITYSSPHPRILEVTVAVVDGNDNPLPGASVTIHLTGTNGVDITATGVTGANGSITFTRRITAACYITDVTSIVLLGYIFDGSEPLNGHQKNVDTSPDADCRGAGDLCGGG